MKRRPDLKLAFVEKVEGSLVWECRNSSTTNTLALNSALGSWKGS